MSWVVMSTGYRLEGFLTVLVMVTPIVERGLLSFWRTPVLAVRIRIPGPKLDSWPKVARYTGTCP